MHIEERNFDELEAENPALRISPKHSEGGDKFFALLEKKKFSAAVAECSKQGKEDAVCRGLKWIAKLPLRVVRRLCFYRRV